MSAATLLADAYGESACLYTTVLGVAKDATKSQLRKAYYKKCLRYHPDKLSSDLPDEERDLAKKKFQAISLAYTILSDEEKRKEYDETGDLYDDDDDLAGGKSGMEQWTSYFNSIFPKVTTADIDAFEVKWKCSDEEEADVLKYYAQFEGDLNKMLECVMLSSDADKRRWVKDYIEPAIERGEADDYMAQVNKTLGSAPAKKKKTKGGGKKNKKRVEMEESESESDSDVPVAEMVEDDMEEENKSNKSKKSGTGKASAKKKSTKAKASKPSKEEDLFAAIRGNALARREEGFDSMMAGLEERYGGKKKTKGGKKKTQKNVDDIDDEEFAKIQARLMKNKGSR